MEDLNQYLEFLPKWASALIAAVASFALILSRIAGIRDFVRKVFRFDRRGDLSKAIDLIVEQGFDSFSRVARLQMGEIRVRRESILDESALGVFLRISRLFDDLIESRAALSGSLSCLNHIQLEKSLFESVARMLLNLGIARAERLFEADDVVGMSDQEFRRWTSDKIEVLSDYIFRNLTDSYPTGGLIASVSDIEKMILSNKSDIRDAVFSAFFRVREVESGIRREIDAEKKKFSDFKTKIFEELQ